MTGIRGDIESAKGVQEIEEIVYPETPAVNKKLEWFQDLKLGVIFHYGLYAQAGIVESWQLSQKDEWARTGRAYRENFSDLQLDYWNLISQFNPTELNTDDWAELCKEAGFKYSIFTTKHHDGFNLYNTMETEYKVGGKLSPCKKDIFKEVVESFSKAGLGIGAYYSKADWYSPFYWLDDATIKGRNASYDTKKHPEIWNRYKTFVHNQIHEITHNYGKIDLLWLDAGWCGQGKEDLDMDRLAEIAREQQEDLLIVDRMMGGRHENYVTPERKVPDFSEIPKKPWESNIPIGNDWGYVPTDTFKEAQELIESLVDVVSKGGNLILGVGPTPEGTFTPEETQRLKELGAWLKDYGKGIYGTRADLTKAVPHFHLTFSKDKSKFFAFCKDQKVLPEKIYLGEILAEETMKICDLKTENELPFYSDAQGVYLLKADLFFPEIGLCGLEISSH